MKKLGWQNVDLIPAVSICGFIWTRQWSFTFRFMQGIRLSSEWPPSCQRLWSM